MDLAGLPKRIEALREARGLSKAALAREAEMDRGVLIELEAGVRAKVYLGAVAAIALALEIRPSTLLRPWEELPGRSRKPPVDLDVFLFGVRTKLREVRQELGFGCKLAASMSGVQQPWLVRVEMGTFDRVNLETLQTYCAGIEVDLIGRILEPAERAAQEKRGPTRPRKIRAAVEA